MKIITTILLLLSVQQVNAAADLKNLYNQALPHLSTQDTYYKEKLTKQSLPDFLKNFTTKAGQYTAFGFTGGSHSGVLFIEKPEKGSYYFPNIGPVSNILTVNDVPFLSPYEIMIISSTGGTGQHHVYGLFFSLRTGKVLGSVPLQGDIYLGGMNISEPIEQQGGTVEFHYTINEIKAQQGSVILKGTFETVFKNVPIDEQKKTLKRFGLRSDSEIFSVHMAPTGRFFLKGVQGVQKQLAGIMTLDKSQQAKSL